MMAVKSNACVTTTPTGISPRPHQEDRVADDEDVEQAFD